MLNLYTLYRRSMASLIAPLQGIDVVICLFYDLCEGKLSSSKIITTLFSRVFHFCPAEGRTLCDEQIIASPFTICWLESSGRRQDYNRYIKAVRCRTNDKWSWWIRYYKNSRDICAKGLIKQWRVTWMTRRFSGHISAVFSQNGRKFLMKENESECPCFEHSYVARISTYHGLHCICPLGKHPPPWIPQHWSGGQHLPPELSRQHV